MLSQRTWPDTVFIPDNVVSIRVLAAPDAERLHPPASRSMATTVRVCQQSGPGGARPGFPSPRPERAATRRW